MKLSHVLVVSTFMLFASTSFAQSDDEDGSLILSFAGIANENVDEREDTDQSEYELNYGFGVLVEAGINDHFGIETGVLYTERQYDAEAGGVRVARNVNRLHIPVVARYWVVDYFSVAAGPYASFKTGSVDNTLSIGNVEVGDVNTSADDTVQWGLDVAATLNFAINDKTGVFVEGRYSMPFDEEPNEDINKVFALAGLKVDL